jgi:hypothetical protein
VVVNHAECFNRGSYAVSSGAEIIHRMDEESDVAVVDLPLGTSMTGFTQNRLAGWDGAIVARPSVGTICARVELLARLIDTPALASGRIVDEFERMSIERACERLVSTYSHFVDFGEAARIADLFSEDGEFTTPGVVTLKGQKELRAGLGERQKKSARIARHVCTNLLVTVLDSDHAEGVVYVTIYRHDRAPGEGDAPPPIGLPLMLGEYRDRFVRTPGGWRFARRETTVAFRAYREKK